MLSCGHEPPVPENFIIGGLGRNVSKRIYVGNFPYTTDEQELREAFEVYGAVTSVNVVLDRYTGRSRGFAFVEMDDEAADEAISKLEGTDFGGRNLRVSEAQPRPDHSGGGGGRGGRDRW